MGDRQVSDNLLSREAVYCLVWNRPAIAVAALFGISSGSLARSCRLRGIPMPDRGYWQRLKAGQSLARPPLLAVEVELPMPWTATAGVTEILSEIRSQENTPRVQTKAVAVEPSRHASQPVRHSGLDSVRRSSSPAPGATQVPATQPVLHARWQRDDPPIAMAKEWLTWEHEAARLERLCARVERQSLVHPAEVKSVMQAWVASVRRQIELDQPMANFIDLCNRLAARREAPSWWAGGVDRDQSTDPSSDLGFAGRQ